jgi:hypothetical protein
MLGKEFMGWRALAAIDMVPCNSDIGGGVRVETWERLRREFEETRNGIDVISFYGPLIVKGI